MALRPPNASTTLWADQQPCQNGLLLEGHSGGYRIEPVRPDGVFVGFRPFEVRPIEVRPEEVLSLIEAGDEAGAITELQVLGMDMSHLEPTHPLREWAEEMIAGLEGT